MKHTLFVIILNFLCKISIVVVVATKNKFAMNIIKETLTWSGTAWLSGSLIGVKVHVT